MVRLTRLSPKPLAAKSELGREGGGTVKAQRCKAANRASKHLAQSLQRSQKNNYPNLGMLGGLGSRGILNLNSRVLAQVVIPVRQSPQTIYGISPATRKGRKENYPNLASWCLAG